MKKSILNLGKALNKEEQKKVSGGLDIYKPCNLPDYSPCGNGWCYKGVCGPVNPF